MLLFDVGVQGWVAEVGLRAVAALEVAAFNVVLGAALILGSPVVVSAVIVRATAPVVVSSSTHGLLVLADHALHLVTHGANHMRHTWIS